ncbi:DNA helicase [Handroanthus impetiginosus]|uniref:DNA helicase n=1 Tax=Handroanthus impetiginosus TaxID=429701 RepID=A0A2G9I5N4_9LAMI|nr:DNA helicase [Handroanthus impetiginosus]
MAQPQKKKMPIDIVDHELTYDTQNTYSVLFFGDSILTTVTHDGAIASQWISDVEFIHRHHLQCLIVGLDVEWCSSYYGCISNPVATLQLSIGDRCLIFQLIHCSSIPSSLVNFLANPNYTFVGVGIKQDLEKLESLAAEAYGRKELKNAGVKVLARVVMGKEVDKPKEVTLSRWDNQRLTPAQVQYACVDAFVCFKVGRILITSSASGRRWKMGLLCVVLGGLALVYFGEGVR